MRMNVVSAHEYKIIVGGHVCWVQQSQKFQKVENGDGGRMYVHFIRGIFNVIFKFLIKLNNK